MKVIKEGKIPEPKIYRYTCSYCNTIFECDEDENMYNKYCPLCHRLVFSTPKKYPTTPRVKWWKFWHDI